MPRFVPGQLLTGRIPAPVQVLGTDAWGGSMTDDTWFVVATLPRKGLMTAFVLLHSRTCRLIVTDDAWVRALALA